MRRVEHRAPRAPRPAPAGGVARPRGYRPVGAEGPEVVDAGEVEVLEGPAQALHPPAVAPVAQGAPVVDRVAPELPLGREGVGRDAGHDVVAEELGMADVVGAAGRDVDGHVADQAHAALVGIHAQCRPLAVEADLVVDGPRAAGEGRPVVDPEPVALAELRALGLGHRRVGIGQEPAPCSESRRCLVGRALTIGRPERQHLPPGLARRREPVDELQRGCAKLPARKRGQMQLHAAGSWKSHVGKRGVRARPRQGQTA